jgi:deoxyribonuclease IV
MVTGFRFGTVGSPLSTPKKPGGSVGAAIQLRSLNLGALELGWVQSVRVLEETCRQIQSTAKEQDILISVHAPYFINLNADSEEWPKSRQRLMDSAYYGYLAGATDIIFHPGSYFGKPPAEVLPIAIERLTGCTAELQTKNIPVILRPETMGKTAMLGSLQDTIEMARNVPGVKPCIDFAHLHARQGDGSMNSKEEWCRELEKYATALGPGSLSTLHIHLSGIEYSSKGEKNHLPIKESDLDLAGLFQALKQFNCGGRILCESPEMENDAIYMRDFFEAC